MKINTRLATKEDAELIADLSRQTFYDTFAAQNSKEDMDKFMNEQFTKKALMEEVGKPENIFFLAYVNDEVAGYVRMRSGKNRPEFGDKSCIEIARIYATGKSVGKGIGSALMQKCIDTAKEMNRELIWLGVWQTNLRAIEFYKKWGFEIFATDDFLLGNDLQKDFLMMKTL